MLAHPVVLLAIHIGNVEFLALKDALNTEASN